MNVKKHLLTNSISLLLFSQIEVLADINMKNAHYYRIDQDIIPLTANLTLTLRRLFSSRSNRLGFFGYGWCSDLESKLIVQRNVAVLDDCHFEQPIKYLKNSFSPGKHPSEWLVVSHNEKLRRVGRQFLRLAADGTEQTYSLGGRLLQVRYSQGNSIRLFYNQKGQLQSLLTENGQVFDVEKDDLHRITAIRIGNKQLAFDYKNFDLVAVHGDVSSFEYGYSSSHNLTQFSSKSGEIEKIKYDELLDRVQTVSSTDGCMTSVSISDLGNKFGDYKTRLRRSCPNGNVDILTYEFLHDFNFENQRVFKTFRMEEPKTTAGRAPSASKKGEKP